VRLERNPINLKHGSRHLVYFCDVTLLHLPKDGRIDKPTFLSQVRRYHGPTEFGHYVRGDLWEINRGWLYEEEGEGRSLSMGDRDGKLENMQTYVLLTQWRDREAGEQFKDPTQETITINRVLEKKDWYDEVFLRPVADLESRGVVREEIQADLQAWYDWERYDRLVF